MRSDEGKNWMKQILFYYQFKLFNIIDGDVRYKERRNSKRPKRTSWDVDIRLTWFCKWCFSFEIRTWFQPVLTRGISRSVFILIVNVYIYFLSIQTYGPKFTRQLNITNFWLKRNKRGCSLHLPRVDLFYITFSYFLSTF